MLRKISARYQAGRSNDLLKLKRHQDAEATVIGYRLGMGKYKGKMGSMLVRTAEGHFISAVDLVMSSAPSRPRLVVLSPTVTTDLQRKANQGLPVLFGSEKTIEASY